MGVLPYVDKREISTYLGSDPILGHDLEPFEGLVPVPGPGASGDGARVARRVGCNACVECVFSREPKRPQRLVFRDNRDGHKGVKQLLKARGEDMAPGPEKTKIDKKDGGAKSTRLKQQKGSYANVGRIIFDLPGVAES